MPVERKQAWARSIHLGAPAETPRSGTGRTGMERARGVFARSTILRRRVAVCDVSCVVAAVYSGRGGEG
eukprot:scaffold100679_cov43-Phaeocystis_antarctica.AAC.1